VLALSVASCGSSQGGKAGPEVPSHEASSSPSQAVTPVAVISASESDTALRPKIVRVAKPGVVEVHVRNSGHSIHGLQIDGPRAVSKTRPLAPGQSATLRANLNVAGEYEWYSPVADDSDKGLRGVIVVAEKLPRRQHRSGNP